MPVTRTEGPFLNLTGKPIRHLTGKETAESLAGITAYDRFTCLTTNRTQIRYLLERAANISGDHPLYKAYTRPTLVEGLLIVFVDYRPETSMLRINAPTKTREANIS
jgi:hypothetical protein